MTDPARRTQLGKTGPSVFPIALGCMAMSGAYAPSDEDEGIAAILPKDAIAGTRYPEANMKHLHSEK